MKNRVFQFDYAEPHAEPHPILSKYSEKARAEANGGNRVFQFGYAKPHAEPHPILFQKNHIFDNLQKHISARLGAF